MSAQTFELSVLAKPYFDAEGLFIAESGEQLLGFAHLGFAPQDDMADANIHHAVLAAMAVIHQPNEDEIAAALLSSIEGGARKTGAICIDAMPPVPYAPFYVGFGPGDSIRGVAQQDIRLIGWLASAGFQTRTTTVVWELELVEFHPPMDRQQIHIRRSAHVDRRLDEPIYPWRLACQMGHTEQISFELVLRSGNTVMCRALMWTIEQSLVPSAIQTARLWWPKSLPSDLLDYYTFLLSEAIRQLAADRFGLVRAVTTDDDPASSVLERLGFRKCEEGRLFVKDLASTGP